MTRNDDEADIIRYVNNITAYKRNVVLTAVLNLLAFVLKGHIRFAGKVFLCMQFGLRGNARPTRKFFPHFCVAAFAIEDMLRRRV